MMRLDPLSLPVKFETRDARADGGLRHVEIDLDRVVLRRAVRGMRMAINVRMHDFLGLAKRADEAGQVLMLVHRDPSLSIPVLASIDDAEIDDAARHWGAMLSLPLIDEDDGRAGPPAQRRRRHHVIKSRRPKFLTRRRGGGLLHTMPVYRGEREIIARS
jgi:hypothetical protein